MIICSPSSFLTYLCFGQASAKSFINPEPPGIADLIHNRAYLSECVDRSRPNCLTLGRRGRYERGRTRREASPTNSSHSGTTVTAESSSRAASVVNDGVTEVDDHGLSLTPSVLRSFEGYLTGTCSIMDSDSSSE